MQALLDNPAQGDRSYAGNDPINQVDPDGLKSYKYSGSGAANYARKYSMDETGTDGYNLMDYDQGNATGGDCANFVSRSMYRGGHMDQDHVSWDAGWFYDRIEKPNSSGYVNGNPKVENFDKKSNRVSYAWQNNQGLFDWIITNRSRGKTTSLRSSLRKGDLIFLKIHGTAIHDHVVMVTGKYTKTVIIKDKKVRVKEVKISSHTEGRNNITWDDWYPLWNGEVKAISYVKINATGTVVS